MTIEDTQDQVVSSHSLHFQDLLGEVMETDEDHNQLCPDVCRHLVWDQELSKSDGFSCLHVLLTLLHVQVIQNLLKLTSTNIKHRQ